MEHTRFVGLDIHKERISIAVAESGRSGALEYLGEIANDPGAIRKLCERLGHHGTPLTFCYEAGPCGYGVHRQLTGLGHRCDVVAPSLIPKKSGDRVKTNRRDATMLARLHRAGELTAVWVPDADHEAMRDLVRLRGVVRQIVTHARQHLQGFLLRHGRKHGLGTAWRMAYRRWLSTLAFEHPAQQIAFQDYVDAVTDAERRLQREELYVPRSRSARCLHDVGSWTTPADWCMDMRLGVWFGPQQVPGCELVLSLKGRSAWSLDGRVRARGRGGWQ